MKRFLKLTALTLLVLLVLAAGGFLIWAATPSQAQSAALTALQSDEAVTVSDNGRYITFQPAAGQPTTGFIFYPGGHVDYRAYAPILHKIAAEGILVALVPVKLNLAFFDIEAGAPVLTDFPQIQVWATGGHSLGGVASALFAKNHPQIRGLIFWASYPADDSLKNAPIKMLSIYGTQDGGLDNGAQIEKYKAFQPADTIFVVIEGGNHGQFGDYGPQPGDKPATISPESQWQQTAQATVKFLQSLGR
ncbi:MAG: alpha/beta hydrolase [Anaerolineales bacterium]